MKDCCHDPLPIDSLHAGLALSPPARGRVIHIDQSAMESRRTEVKWTDVQRLKATGNKEGKCLTVVSVVTQSLRWKQTMQNNL